MTGDPKTPLVVVVNGAETAIEANLHAPLRTVVQHALQMSGNQGRPIEDWELRDADGNLLDLSRKTEEFKFAPGTVLYLTLLVGVNGRGALELDVGETAPTGVCG